MTIQEDNAKAIGLDWNAILEACERLQLSIASLERVFSYPLTRQGAMRIMHELGLWDLDLASLTGMSPEAAYEMATLPRLFMQDRPRYVITYRGKTATFATKKSAMNRLAWWIIWERYGEKGDCQKSLPRNLKCKCDKANQLRYCPIHDEKTGYFARLNRRIVSRIKSGEIGNPPMLRDYEESK